MRRKTIQLNKKMVIYFLLTVALTALLLSLVIPIIRQNIAIHKKSTSNKYIEKFNNSSFNENTKLVIVTAHFNEDLDWLKNAKFPVVVCNKTASDLSDLSDFNIDNKCSMELNRGREASVFLRFIIVYYDTLPKHTAFIHGHETAWHQKHPDGILKAIDQANIDKYDYISLNNNLMSLRYEPYMKFNIQHPTESNYIDNTDMSRVVHRLINKYWTILFEPELKIDFPEKLRYQQSAQFIVSRDLIRKHPKSFYIQLYNFIIDPNEDDYHTSVALEFLWHIIFGEKPDTCETDIHDPLYNNCTNETYLNTRFTR